MINMKYLSTKNAFILFSCGCNTLEGNLRYAITSVHSKFGIIRNHFIQNSPRFALHCIVHFGFKMIGMNCVKFSLFRTVLLISCTVPQSKYMGRHCELSSTENCEF